MSSTSGSGRDRPLPLRAAQPIFKMSSPDGTCSLSFNANTTALLSSPYVSQDLPQSELAKLDGPANIHGDTLEVSMYNASSWNVREITVGLTIVRHDDTSADDYGAAKLLLAASEDATPADKHSDVTLLLHLKGSSAPFATTVYREKLDEKSLTTGKSGIGQS